ncbi:unnamed protein product [Cylicocyclus nassatus]|uniref:Uncharacterized protein n=1 Tax=Cylicocyclus nassatus TaxID=53992 RepID=A0AA36HGC7_CYLNA|nr:unnamed protein product [Cylicocyclus nassatus]
MVLLLDEEELLAHVRRLCGCFSTVACTTFGEEMTNTNLIRINNWYGAVSRTIGVAVRVPVMESTSLHHVLLVHARRITALKQEITGLEHEIAHLQSLVDDKEEVIDSLLEWIIKSRQDRLSKRASTLRDEVLPSKISCCPYHSRRIDQSSSSEEAPSSKRLRLSDYFKPPTTTAESSRRATNEEEVEFRQSRVTTNSNDRP